MQNYSFAIIGCGHIAHKHAEAIGCIPGCSLTSVCDNDSGKGRQFADKYGASFYDDYSEMLKQPNLNIICVCTPSGLHARDGVEAARAGKHVLVEKPMALNLQDADLLIEACDKAGVTLAVVYQNRFKPAVQKLHRAIEGNKFGKLTHANATVRWNRNDEYYAQCPWRGSIELDGGVLMNQAIHNIDLLQWMFGPVESIHAYTATRLRKIEAEDVGVAIIKFKNGALGVIEAATTLYPKNLEESLSIFGEKGTAVISGITASEIKNWIFQDETNYDIEPGPTGHQAVIEDMLRAIAQGSKPLVDGNEGRKSLEMVLAICRSAKSGSSWEVGK